MECNALNQWASQPPESYVSITPGDDELENLFEDLAKNISKPGAKNIVIAATLIIEWFCHSVKKYGLANGMLK